MKRRFPILLFPILLLSPLLAFAQQSGDPAKPPGAVIAKAAMSPDLKPGSCSTAHSISCGQ